MLLRSHAVFLTFLLAALLAPAAAGAARGGMATAAGDVGTGTLRETLASITRDDSAAFAFGTNPTPDNHVYAPLDSQTTVAANIGNQVADFEDVDESLHGAMEKLPDDPIVLYEFGKKAWAAGQGYTAQAALIRALEHGSGLPPNADADARKILDDIYADGDALAVMQARDDAAGQERFLTHRIDAHPDDSVARALRGFARRDLYRINDAIEDFTEAQRIGIGDFALKSEVQQARVDLERHLAENELRGHHGEQEFYYYDIREQETAFLKLGDWRGLERYLERF